MKKETRYELISQIDMLWVRTSKAFREKNVKRVLPLVMGYPYLSADTLLKLRNDIHKHVKGLTSSI